TMEAALDEHENISMPAYALLPEARTIIMQLMSRVEGERLGRSMIVRLPPGGHITAHRDTGSHAEYYDRFHVVLQSKPGNRFICGGEIVEMRVGEVWWFQNQLLHEVMNMSDDDRLHMIVDIRLPR
ncbi:MAG: aspartyl/asparaginyl beta-hydroxylase domain-containing protein, partial [Pyrinomonadaceae bacterium]